jgi:protease IV
MDGHLLGEAAEQAPRLATLGSPLLHYNARFMRRSSFYAVLLTMFLHGGARAQLPEPPTQGLYNPTVGVAGDVDASNLERNPAGLGFLRSWSGVYLHSQFDEAKRPGPGGDGFFFAMPVPYLSAFSIGIGVQSIRPPAIWDYKDLAKFSLGLAWRPFPSLALGFNYSHLWSDTMNGLDTMDLAVAMRPLSWLAAGLVVHDVPGPTPDLRPPVQRVWEPEIALRFFSGRLELSLGARFGERRGDVDPRFRLWVMPAPGVWVKTDIMWRPDVDLDGIYEHDLRIGIGLALDLERIGVSAFGLFGVDSDKTNWHGWTLSARVSGERYPTFWRGPTYLEKIDLGPGMSQRALAALLLKLRKLEKDRRVAGVVVVVGDLGGGWGTAEEIRASLLRLRHAKKHVYVYLTESNTRTYYIASAGERIYQDPAGGIRITGLHSTAFYFKGTGELIGVAADFVKIAEYKAAPEQYTRSGSTAPAKQQREQMAEDVYQNVVEGIAGTRKVSREQVKQWIDHGPFTAAEAKQHGLIDEIKGGDEVEPAIAERLGRHVSIGEPSKAPERPRTWVRPKVAVLMVDGDITDGKSSTIPILNMRAVGLQTLLPAIARARADANVKAIVLRVNSPGGSALASDLLARELTRTRSIKPVICSFGDIAASGGYYIATGCGRIFAAPSTLTGSIGIFTGKFDLSGLAKKLGVTVESTERGKHASIESMFRPYTDEERDLILDKLRYYYGRFVDAVARGRNLSAAEVEAVARGHVWSGMAAQARGLVDDFGSFADAVMEAKKQAGLDEDDPTEVELLPEEPSLLGQLASLLGINLSAKENEISIVPGLADALSALPASLLLAPSTPQARLDANITIK